MPGQHHDGEANDPHEARTADEDAREEMEDFLAACRIRSVVRVVAHHDDDWLTRASDLCREVVRSLPPLDKFRTGSGVFSERHNGSTRSTHACTRKRISHRPLFACAARTAHCARAHPLSSSLQSGSLALLRQLSLSVLPTRSLSLDPSSVPVVSLPAALRHHTPAAAINSPPAQ